MGGLVAGWVRWFGWLAYVGCCFAWCCELMCSWCCVVVWLSEVDDDNEDDDDDDDDDDDELMMTIQ